MRMAFQWSPMRSVPEPFGVAVFRAISPQRSGFSGLRQGQWRPCFLVTCFSQPSLVAVVGVHSTGPATAAFPPLRRAPCSWPLPIERVSDPVKRLEKPGGLGKRPPVDELGDLRRHGVWENALGNRPAARPGETRQGSHRFVGLQASCVLSPAARRPNEWFTLASGRRESTGRMINGSGRGLSFRREQRFEIAIAYDPHRPKRIKLQKIVIA